MPDLTTVLRTVFYASIVKPFVYVALGYNVEGYENLPHKGPAILVANHNSHIDTLLLLSIFHSGEISHIHPVAAADYFCNTKLKSFIFKTLLGIIPLSRKVNRENKDSLFSGIYEALNNNEIVIIYPEGTRGDDDTIKDFKTGIAHIAKDNPKVPIVPIYINGPDKILPRLELLLVPFISDIYISEPLYWDETSIKDFTYKIQDRITALKELHKHKEL